MRDRGYRETQWAARYAPHVEPLNRLVDDLRQKGLGSVPYVGPDYGGVEAEAVLVFQDPGKGTDATLTGSGFMSWQNDDPSAQLLCECLEAAGLSPERLISWNACPWYVNGAPTAAQSRASLDAFAAVLACLNRPPVVVLHGKRAQAFWPQFRAAHRPTTEPLRTFDTFHTSGQGIINGGQQKKAAGVAHVVETFERVRSILDEQPRS